MKNTTAVAIALFILMGAGFFVFQGDKQGESKTPSSITNNSGGVAEVKNQVANGAENSITKDGIQYVTIVARGGYSPRESFAKAGVKTKLIVKTNGTYDCSAALLIHSLKYRKMLPNTGETIIDVGTPKAGDVLQGVCGMGMYSFAINFK